MKNKKTILLGLAVLAVTLVLDQFTKWLMLEKILTPERPGIEVTSFFNLVIVWNPGISFGMFAGHNQPMLLTALAVVILAILLKWLIKNTSMPTAAALGFIMGGAIGNIIDRQRFGAVVDFLDFHIGNLHWPAFNVADSAIFIGVVLLCIVGMFTKESQQTETV